jgi:hypothetical protein
MLMQVQAARIAKGKGREYSKINVPVLRLNLHYNVYNFDDFLGCGAARSAK